jgi:ADP-heptose:LPS heptosyltransferase
MIKKVLIIRFSSFGDIIHCRSVLKPLKEQGIEEISWLVRADLAGALEKEPFLDKRIDFNRKAGLFGLIKLAFELRKNKYDIVYDAHNNIRSMIVRLILGFWGPRLIIRPKERWKRLLLFKFGLNRFPKPFKGMVSYWKPLKTGLDLSGQLSPQKWPIEPGINEKEILKGRIVLVPATAWPMKSWPVENWKKLVEILGKEKFIILGGPADQFCEEIKMVDPDRVENWAGRYNLQESCTLAAHADFIVTADTGLQQVADLAGRKGLSLIGPTAFGFPTMGTLKVLEADLPCRPCSKDGSGKCSRDIYQECMTLLTPEMVAKEIVLTKDCP